MKAIVFGATESAYSIYQEIRESYEIVAFCDNDKSKWDKKLDGIIIISPKEILSLQWDEIIIASLSSMNTIKNQLLNMEVPLDKINISYVDYRVKSRIGFLKDFAKIVYEYNLPGCVAEAGVFQGEFAKEINTYFSDRKLYLFDTFEGFDKRDIKIEQAYAYSKAKTGHLNITSENIVIEKMTYPQNCIIRRGYFPETIKEPDKKEIFCFVSLDMDLYKPTLEGLQLFYPQMIKGGIILVHDFFSNGYAGVKAAVNEFADKYNIVPFPIGDSVSIAVQKK